MNGRRGRRMTDMRFVPLARAVRALQLPQTSNEMTEQMRDRLRLYQSRKPYHVKE